jgi:gamma-glutamyltranspeptidase/glutathione hydrolase
MHQFIHNLFHIVVLLSTLSLLVTSISLSPATWPPGTIEQYFNYTNTYGYKVAKPAGISMNGKGIVSGTSSAIAVHVATDALSKGANAMDAMLAAIMAQVTVAAGSYVSFAGLLGLVYYNAKDGKLYSLSGNWNKPYEYNKDDTCKSGQYSCMGQKTLVPGFFKAVEAASKRFGELPLSTLLEPSIYFAEQGFPTHTLLSHLLNSKYGDRLAQSEEGSSLLINPDTGKRYKFGELYRQPHLANVLRNISENGVDYMYSGEWGQKMVKSVQEHKGYINRKDMENYEAIWDDPFTTTYHSDNMVIHSMATDGGISVIETMNIIELLNIQSKYNESAQLLFDLIQAGRWNSLLRLVVAYAPKMLNTMFPDIDLTREGRLTKETAQKVFDLVINNPKKLEQIWYHYYKQCPTYPSNPCRYTGPHDKDHTPDPFQGHSDAFSIIDQYGNAVAVVHSMNALPWGTGIVVDGIALSDATTANGYTLYQTQPGQQIPFNVEPTIVTYNGKPIIAQGTIGGGLHESTLLNLVNILESKLTPKQACDMPHFQFIDYQYSYGCYPKNQTIAVGTQYGQFTEQIVQQVQQQLGQCLNVLRDPLLATSTGTPGYSAIVYSNDNYQQQGGTDKELNGWSEGL